MIARNERGIEWGGRGGDKENRDGRGSERVRERNGGVSERGKEREKMRGSSGGGEDVEGEQARERQRKEGEREREMGQCAT